jgi:hypothetical protein
MTSERCEQHRQVLQDLGMLGQRPIHRLGLVEITGPVRGDGLLETGVEVDHGAMA